MSKNAMKALRKYPAFYMLRISFGYGLFASEGKHRGACFGTLYSDKDLELYGAENFAKRGGLAWSRYGQRERFVATNKELFEAATWVDTKGLKQ